MTAATMWAVVLLMPRLTLSSWPATARRDVKIATTGSAPGGGRCTSQSLPVSIRA